MQQRDEAGSTTLISSYECPIDTCTWAYEVPQMQIGRDTETADAFAAAFEQQAVAIETAVRQHCETHDVEDWLRTVMGLREQLAAPTLGLACFGCIVARHNAQQQGVPAEQLPVIGLAEFVVEGRSLGMCHLNLTSGPVLPGRTQSGLIVNGHGGQG
jgi:hypothetical protein